MSAISRPEASVSMWPASTNSARLLVHHAPMTSATRMAAVIPTAIVSLLRWVPYDAWAWSALMLVLCPGRASGQVRELGSASFAVDQGRSRASVLSPGGRR